MKKVNAAYRPLLVEQQDRLLDQFVENAAPVWRPVTTVELANLLGVSVQSLANWRVRGNGPPSILSRRGKRRLYRLDEALEWATGTPAWKICRAWLVKRGLVPPGAQKEDIQWVVSIFQ